MASNGKTGSDAQTKADGDGYAGFVPRPRADWLARRKAQNTDGNFSQMHYARQGVITEEMEYVAGARISPPNWCAMKSRRTHDHPCEHQPCRAGADGDRRGREVQDQLQYRQLRRHLEFDEELRSCTPRFTTAPTR